MLKIKLGTVILKSIQNEVERNLEAERILLSNGEALILNLNDGAKVIHVYKNGQEQCHYTNNINVPMDYSNDRIFVVEDEAMVRTVVDEINLGLINKIKKIKYCGRCGIGRKTLIV